MDVFSIMIGDSTKPVIGGNSPSAELDNIAEAFDDIKRISNIEVSFLDRSSNLDIASCKHKQHYLAWNLVLTGIQKKLPDNKRSKPLPVSEQASQK